jgi:uroporphyrin-III C-methyltransferase / precorrin-2 dehydrogenase / sirohydrochlorin ferrochelatase
MRYFPVFMDMEGADILVVGGGEQAAQKVRLIARTPARITLIAEGFAAELVALAATGRVQLVERAFATGDVAGRTLVYAAADPDLNTAVAAAARAAGLPVNVVDEPDKCSFLTPAIVDRDPITIAIGTEGSAPVIGREIKAKLEAWLPARFGLVATAAAALRDRVGQEIGTQRDRRRFWERLLVGPFRQAVMDNDQEAAAAAVDQEIAIANGTAAQTGRIVLIGCGPGDADLLTLKAQQYLQQADVLVIDRLVDPRILDYARRDARRIDVGKTPAWLGGGPSAGQDEINAILVREAQAGNMVARLKGGDPFIFGRATEELVAAQQAGIAVEIVPGITAAHACAARIGLPVTVRGQIRQFSVLTGATHDGVLDFDWPSLANEAHAFAVYMGVASASALRKHLLAADADPDRPVVIVENGTLPNEKVVATRLIDLDAAIAAHGLKGPAIIFIGLDWADSGLTKPASVVTFRAGRLAETPGWTASSIAQATHWVMG